MDTATGRTFSLPRDRLLDAIGANGSRFVYAQGGRIQAAFSPDGDVVALFDTDHVRLDPIGGIPRGWYLRVTRCRSSPGRSAPMADDS